MTARLLQIAFSLVSAPRARRPLQSRPRFRLFRASRRPADDRAAS